MTSNRSIASRAVRACRRSARRSRPAERVTSGDSSSMLIFAPPLAGPPDAAGPRSIARKDRAHGRGASAGPRHPARDLRDRIQSKISGLSFSPRTTKIAITKPRARAPIAARTRSSRERQRATGLTSADGGTARQRRREIACGRDADLSEPHCRSRHGLAAARTIMTRSRAGDGRHDDLSMTRGHQNASCKVLLALSLIGIITNIREDATCLQSN